MFSKKNPHLSPKLIEQNNFSKGVIPSIIVSDLNIAGDLIAGAGIATQSISIDGLSQSVGTTSSATNSGYGARVIQFNKELKELMTTLRAKYKIIGFGAR